MTPLDPRIGTLFKGPHLAHLATLMADGSPHVTPIWIDIEGDTPTFGKASSAIATANLRRDPRVAISINSVEDPYEATYVRGRAIEVREPAEATARWAGRLSVVYTGKEIPNGVEAGLVFVRFVVEVERATFFLADELEHTPPGDWLQLPHRL